MEILTSVRRLYISFKSPVNDSVYSFGRAALLLLVEVQNHTVPVRERGRIRVNMLYLHSALQTENYSYEIYNFSPGLEWDTFTNKGPQLNTTFSWRRLFLSTLPYILDTSYPFRFLQHFQYHKRDRISSWFYLRTVPAQCHGTSHDNHFHIYSDIIATNFQRFGVFL